MTRRTRTKRPKRPGTILCLVTALAVSLSAPAGAFFERHAPRIQGADHFEYGYTSDRPPYAAPHMIYPDPVPRGREVAPDYGIPVYTPRSLRFQEGYPHTVPSTGWVRGYIYLPGR